MSRTGFFFLHKHTKQTCKCNLSGFYLTIVMHNLMQQVTLLQICCIVTLDATSHHATTNHSSAQQTESLAIDL